MRNDDFKVFVFLLMVSIYASAVLADADLVISSSADPSLIAVNGSSYIFVDVTNYGADPALDVTISTTLASGLNLVSATVTQGACAGTNPLICSLGTINSGNLGVQSTVSIEVTANTIGTISNVFGAITSSIDSNSDNNSASAMIEVVALEDSADQGVAYDTMPDWAYQGSNTLYPVLVTNNGPATVTQSTVTFYISQLSLSDFVSAVPDQGDCSTALDGCIGLACLAALALPLYVTCDLGGISSGSSVAVGITTNMAGNVGDTLQLTASVDSDSTADAEQRHFLIQSACGIG